MKLHEIKAQEVTIQAIFDELSTIFQDDDLSQDDTIKLKQLDLKGEVIELHVETHALESDYSTTIRRVGQSLEILGFDEPISVKLEGSADDIANSVLGAISSAADDEDTQRRDEDDTERDD